MGGQGDLRAAVIVYIHCMRTANQSAMRVASSVHVSVPEMLNIALDERRQERKAIILRTTSGPRFGNIILQLEIPIIDYSE